MWLFYYDYLTEHTWQSISFSISFLATGVLLNYPFLKWLYKSEIVRNPQLYDKIEKVAVLIMKISGIVAAITFFIGIFGPLLLTCLWGLYEVIYYAWEWWLVVIMLGLISFLMRQSKVPVLKTLSKILYRVFLLSFIALVAYIAVRILINTAQNDSQLIDSYIAAFMILLAASAYAVYLFYVSLKKGVLSFALMRYVLFLRAFKDDENLSYKFKNLESNLDTPLIKVGDPSNSEESNINEHLLPLSNWKFFLKYYMTRARALAIIVGSTDGLLWEVIQNIEALQKCVFSFSTHRELEMMKEKLTAYECNRSKRLIVAIEKVLDCGCVGWDPAFVVYNDVVYVGDFSVLVNAVLKNNFSEIGTHIYLNAVDTIKRDSRINKVRNYLFKHLHLLGIVNTLESTHNYVLKSILIGTLYLLAIAFVAGLVAVGVGMLIVAVLMWCVDDIGFDSSSTIEKISCCGTLIAFGIYCIKTAIEIVTQKE